MNYSHINRALWGDDREYLNNLLVKSLAELKEENSIEEANYKRERLRADLLLATDGSPEAVERIYKGTAPLNSRGEPEITDEYREQISVAVSDALRSSPNLTIAELKKWYGKYPSTAILLMLTGLEAKEYHEANSIENELDLLETESEAAYEGWINHQSAELNSNNHSGVFDLTNLNLFGDCENIAVDLKDIAASLRGKPNLVEFYKLRRWSLKLDKIV